ncbi:hypothetical protein KAI04_05150 [Candidatus Pacearchaeota archaeon]|nr:hypothetical protein [Candidatus Pacearchaeota archaeon]
MGEINLKFFIASLLIISSIGLVSADYTLGTPTHNIETSYSLGEKVNGWVSIQFTNESNFTLFEDSEGNSMTLLELITENPDFTYSVNATYGTIDTTTLQNLNLDDGVFNLPDIPGNLFYQFNFSDVEIFIEEIEMTLVVGDLNTALNNKINELNVIKLEINTYDLFEQISLNSALKIDEIESKLANLSLDYVSASTQAELDNISASLSLISIPNQIEVINTAISIPIFPTSENVDLDNLEIVSNSTYESGEENIYKTAIIGWNVDNLDTKISFKEFSASYGDTSESVVSIFDLEIDKKNVLDYKGYIFIEKMNDTLFKQDYQEQEQGDYYVFDFVGDTKIISFSTIEEIDFAELPFFISPAMTELNIEDLEYVEGEENEIKKYDQKKWVIFILAIVLLLILSFILYLVLQTWYKKRYENYLFSDKNDLFNLANYITNSKKRGLDNSQIKESLLKSKWNSEQIRYALRKYSGKRTGMYEIALKKNIEKNKQGGVRNYRPGRYSPK